MEDVVGFFRDGQYNGHNHALFPTLSLYLYPSLSLSPLHLSHTLTRTVLFVFLLSLVDFGDCSLSFAFLPHSFRSGSLAYQSSFLSFLGKFDHIQ